jgi:Domain of unknown function (DUF4349)
MDTDQKLRRLLSDAAESFDPPSLRRQSFWQRRVVRIVGAAVGVCLIIAAVGAVIVGVRSGSHGGPAASSPASTTKNTSLDAGSAGSPSRLAPAQKQTVSSGIAAGPAAAPMASSAPQAASGAVGTGTTNASVPTQTARVVQTGQLALEVVRGQVRPALAKLTTIADGAGGFISQSSDDDSQVLPSGTSTLRVPVASFDAVMAQVRKLGSVTSASTSARDVTSQYVDLNARISALEQERATYYTLLTRATTIGDTLAVQQQIQPLQTELEQLQGQQKVLADSSDLATLTVNVVQKGAAAVTPPKKHSSNGFAKSLRQAGHAFNTGLQAVISALGPILLVLIILGIVGGLVLLGRRVYKVLTR